MNNQDNTTAQSGRAAFDVINGMALMAKGQSTARHLKTHAPRMPVELIPNGKGGFGVKNFIGFMNGFNTEMRFPKDHQIDKGDLDLSGLTPDEDGVYYLHDRDQYPWDNEGAKQVYLGRIAKLFKIPTHLSRRTPTHRHGAFAGQ